MNKLATVAPAAAPVSLLSNQAKVSFRQKVASQAKVAHFIGALFLGVVGFASLNTASAELLDDVKAAGKLTIGTEGVYAPYTYHDDSGKLTGFDVEVGRAIAAKLGVEPVFVETSWDGLIAGLDAKRYDIVTRADWMMARSSGAVQR